MDKAHPTALAPAKPSRWLAGLVIGFTLLVFGGTVALSRWQLRQQIQGQISRRDGEILTAVALLLQYGEESETAGGVREPSDQFPILLKTSRLRGVIASRLFDAAGQFVMAFPPEVKEAVLEAGDLAELRQLRSTSHFLPQADLDRIFYRLTDPATHSPASLPLLEVNIPIYPKADARLAGIAQFYIDGRGIAAEYAVLDRHLLRQAVVTLVTGGGAICLALGWAFRRIARGNRLLADRTALLLKANQELSQAAKTSAVGTVTAHLIHGLRNPLSGLHNLMTARTGTGGPVTGDEWLMAAASTRRMRALVDEVVRVLREEQGVSSYELSLGELVEILAAKATPLAREADIHFQVAGGGAAQLTNHQANLILLILDNLIRNALQATPKGKTVRFHHAVAGDDLVFEVQDEGPGFPRHLSAALFAPCQSTKTDGAGIGLAISKQLAEHLGAALELKSSSAQGCLFALRIPKPQPGGKVGGALATESGG